MIFVHAKKSAPFDPIWPYLAPCGPIWARLPHLALFGPIWPRLYQICPVWSHLAQFVPICPLLSMYSTNKLLHYVCLGSAGVEKLILHENKLGLRCAKLRANLGLFRLCWIFKSSSILGHLLFSVVFLFYVVFICQVFLISSPLHFEFVF